MQVDLPVRTELRLRPGSCPAVVELWYDVELIGTAAGAYGRGVRIVTKHHMTSTRLVADTPASLKSDQD